jgi:hypothetical protein
MELLSRSFSGSFANVMTSASLLEAERAAWNKSSCARVGPSEGQGRGVLSTEPCLMLRPDHIWFFFTVVLSLALAMSIPRKPEQQSRADTLVPVAEHYLQ